MVGLDFPVERIQLGFEGSSFRGLASPVERVELGLKRVNFFAQGADVAALRIIGVSEFSRRVRVAARVRGLARLSFGSDGPAGPQRQGQRAGREAKAAPRLPLEPGLFSLVRA